MKIYSYIGVNRIYSKHSFILIDPLRHFSSRKFVQIRMELWNESAWKNRVLLKEITDFRMFDDQLKSKKEKSEASNAKLFYLRLNIILFETFSLVSFHYFAWELCFIRLLVCILLNIVNN